MLLFLANLYLFKSHRRSIVWSNDMDSGKDNAGDDSGEEVPCH